MIRADLAARVRVAIDRLFERSSVSTRGELAMMADLDRSLMAHLGAGRISVPRLETLVALCDAAEVPLSEFRGLLDDDACQQPPAARMSAHDRRQAARR